MLCDYYVIAMWPLEQEKIKLASDIAQMALEKAVMDDQLEV